MKQKIRWTILLGGLAGQIAYILTGGRPELAIGTALGFIAYPLLARYIP